VNAARMADADTTAIERSRSRTPLPSSSPTPDAADAEESHARSRGRRAKFLIARDGNDAFELAPTTPRLDVIVADLKLRASGTVFDLLYAAKKLEPRIGVLLLSDQTT